MVEDRIVPGNLESPKSKASNESPDVAQMLVLLRQREPKEGVLMVEPR
jgi:hypothetical protein